MSKKNKLYLVLCGFFITNAVVAEIIGAKIFSVSKALHLGTEINMSAGVLNWPIVFIVSDLINEYFGKGGVKRISYLTTALIAYAFFVIYGATALPPAGFWIDVNKGTTNLDINHAFSVIFRQGMGIIVGSITAFLLGQILDAFVFHKLRLLTENKHLWLRATGSTLVSQLVDSFVVIYVAFYVFGNWTFDQAFSVSTSNYLYKVIIAIAMTPVIYGVHLLIDKYLGKELASEMAQEHLEK